MADAIAPFAPALSELVIDAWERVGKPPVAELGVQHINSARRSMNFVLVRWANRGINLWRVVQTTVTLQQGVATYTLAPTTIEMLDTYITTTSGGVTTDIVITPMSRNTFAALPNKTDPGRPLLYWMDRTITPSVTLWPVPDSSTAYTMTYFAFTQIADADAAGGNTGNMPYRFLEAYCSAVAAHLALKFADPQRAIALDAAAKETWIEAADNDVEHVTLNMAPDFSDYF